MNTGFNNTPLKTEVLFATCPVTGHIWQKVCLAENLLSEKLKNFPEGTVVYKVGGDAWFLKVKDGERVLCHAEYVNNAVVPLIGASSRFDFDLMFIDISEDDLEDYASRITLATEDFLTTFIPLNKIVNDLKKLPKFTIHDKRYALLKSLGYVIVESTYSTGSWQWFKSSREAKCEGMNFNSFIEASTAAWVDLISQTDK
jgi:hypothetical protein